MPSMCATDKLARLSNQHIYWPCLCGCNRWISGFCQCEPTGRFKGLWQFYAETVTGIMPLNYTPLRVARYDKGPDYLHYMAIL